MPSQLSLAGGSGAICPIVTDELGRAEEVDSSGGRHCRGFRATPASCPQAEEDAGGDPKEPAENGGSENDPNERGVALADDPAQLHLARVRHCKRDHKHEERYENECQV
jgi:hypothetical protein